MGEVGKAVRVRFRDDLLCGIRAQTGDLSEALHRRMMRSEQVRLIELAEVVFDQSRFFQR